MELDIETISKIRSGLSRYKVLVVGDAMLDKYWLGDVNRISPEAPVPIAKIEKTDNRPGGAANVARNIASLGGNVSLLSVIGNDEAGNILTDILNSNDVHTIFEVDNNASTVVKLRVLAKNQQLIRLDFEACPTEESLTKIFTIYTKIIHDYDVVILSDYGKGGLVSTIAMIELANKYNKPILVDPKGDDYSKYANATIITPNKNELRNAIGKWNNENEFAQKASCLRKSLNLNYLLVTRSEDGMSLFNQTTQINYPTVARAVYDVSGAGDTVIGVLGLMLANNIPIEDSVMLANIAAGIVVTKVGTATLDIAELMQSLRNLNYVI